MLPPKIFKVNETIAFYPKRCYYVYSSFTTQLVVDERRLIKWILGLLLVSSLVLTGSAYAYTVKAPEQEIKLNPVLEPVCSCETTGSPTAGYRQFDDNGNLIVGKVNPKDRGACQINLTAHEKEIKKMGLNVDLERDNIIFANYLYSKFGLSPWKNSRNCWKDALDKN